MSSRFLLQHLPVLAGGVLVCIICKTILVGTITLCEPYESDSTKKKAERARALSRADCSTVWSYEHALHS